MLKVYNISYYVSIDGAKWRQVGYGHKATDEELESKLTLDNVSFDDAYEYISNNHLTGLWRGTSLFLKKPLIYVDYDDAWDPVSYRHFDTISYKTECEEWTSVSLNWITQHLPADKCIQYLKDRGMAACPILK